MKIGIMLRHYDQHNGGVKNYTRNLLQQLFSMDNDHEFVLLYQHRRLLGSYQGIPGVSELSLPSPSLLAWDQLAVPWVQRKKKLDIIFNPKYSLPLSVSCPTVFVCHGLDWYEMPWGSTRLNRLNHRFLVPRYAKKADAIIAVSESTRIDLQRFLDVESDKIHVIHHGIGKEFSRTSKVGHDDKIMTKYGLPQRFLLYVSGIYPAKNFDRLLRAFAASYRETGIKLVVAGEHIYLCQDQFKLVDTLGISDQVIFSGWVDHDELPFFYQNAQALLLPSLYEACPSPILEAMAMGCPIVTGDRKGMREIAGGAALLVDPQSVDSIAQGIRTIVKDSSLREKLIARGIVRAREFSWRKCAEQTLSALETAFSRHHRAKESGHERNVSHH